MVPSAYLPEWQRAVTVLSATVVAATVVCVLYFGRSILIPVALAVLLTFVLSPAVAWLHRRGLGRTPAVAAVVGVTILLAAGVGAVVVQQMTGLTESLPGRKDAIVAKINEARNWVIGNGESRFGQMVDEVMNVVNPKPQPPADRSPTPVVVESAESSVWSRVLMVASPTLEVLGTIAFAFVLTVFMLLKKEDLRNRMIRLIGSGQVTHTTKALDDASTRISRYLLTQLVLNTAFGAVIVVGLLIIGLKYALLWGFLATLMRYVPYIGTWVGLIPPTLYSLAVSDGWGQPLCVLALFGGLELLCNNVFEPMLYGPSMGVSEVAQLVAAGFWAFLWGPIGLILSGPLTVVLLILGKYVRRLEFLAVLMGDEPALEPRVAFYQRLAARDQDEASAVALREAEQSSPEAVFDTVVVPALCLAKRDHTEGNLSDADLSFAVRAAREVADEVIDARPAAPAEEAEDKGPLTRVPVLLCPAKDEVDRAAVKLFAGLLDTRRWEVRVAAVDTLVSELLTTVAEFKPAAVVVGAVPPGGLSHSRYIVARIRSKFHDVKILVGRWGRGDEFPDDETHPRITGADWVDDKLAETLRRLAHWHPVFTDEAEGQARPAGKRTPLGTGAAPS
jgi:predicted PurR-regulated permease PerM